MHTHTLQDGKSVLIFAQWLWCCSCARFAANELLWYAKVVSVIYVHSWERGATDSLGLLEYGHCSAYFASHLEGQGFAGIGKWIVLVGK